MIVKNKKRKMIIKTNSNINKKVINEIFKQSIGIYDSNEVKIRYKMKKI